MKIKNAFKQMPDSVCVLIVLASTVIFLALPTLITDTQNTIYIEVSLRIVFWTFKPIAWHTHMTQVIECLKDHSLVWCALNMNIIMNSLKLRLAVDHTIQYWSCWVHIMLGWSQGCILHGELVWPGWKGDSVLKETKMNNVWSGIGSFVVEDLVSK